MMRLLLVLSAFLTALVGLGSAAPAVTRPASEVCASATTKAVRQVPPVTSVSPVERGALDCVDVGSVSLEAAPVRSVPLYAERMRV